MPRTASFALLIILLVACDRDPVDVTDRPASLRPGAPVAATLDDSYGNLILSHQPVGYWRHREAGLYGQPTIDGEQVVDASGYGMHGIYRSLPSDQVESGIFHGDSLTFVAGNPMLNHPGDAAENFGYFSEGADDIVIDSGGARIEIPHDSSLALLEDFSFEAWIRPRPQSDWRYNLIAMNSAHQFNRFGNNDFGYFVLDYWQHPRGTLLEGVNKIDIGWAVASYSWSGWSGTGVYDYEIKAASVDPETGAETHVVGVHENNVVKLYIDGRLVASEDISGDSGLPGPDGQETTGSGFRQDLTDIYNPPDAAKPLMIGGARYIEGEADFVGFSGSLGESAFYRRALSSAEVHDHYEAGVLRLCGDERDIIINEYYKYEVNLEPICDDLADGGGTVHFSWAELNAGWQDGNPHEPWGMIVTNLKVGLENTRLLYNRGAIVVSSGYRCPHGNPAILPAGAKQSRHMYGDAADISSAEHDNTEQELMLLESAAIDAGATYTELYTRHAHADWRPR